MLSLIAAMDEKRGIGKNNALLFKISQDLKRFKQVTTGHSVIMGRKTFESIGRLLPNRTNIIATSNKLLGDKLETAGAIVAYSLEEAIKVAKKTEVLGINHVGGVIDITPREKGEIFIIGGGQIFQQAIGKADKLYLTIVEGDYGADTFFPEYKNRGFHVVRKEKGEENGYKFTFVDLVRS